MEEDFDFGYEEIMSFECYCVEVLDIPYYNFLSKEEWESCYEKYEDYIDRMSDNE